MATGKTAGKQNNKRESILVYVASAAREPHLWRLHQQKNAGVISAQEHGRLLKVTKSLKVNRALEWISEQARIDEGFNKEFRESLVALLRYKGANLDDFTE